MEDTDIPKAGDLAPFETVPLGFESRYTGENTLADQDLSDLNIVFSQDARGYVTMQYSLWGCFHTTEDTWNDEIHAINRMQAALGPLSDDVRRIRAHIASLVPCDNGVPVTIDEILNAIGTGRLPEPAFHPGCWLSAGTRGTQPQQTESMCDIEAILTGYLDGLSAAALLERYPYARGFIERSFSWLGPRADFTPVQKLMLERLLLPFAFFTKRNPNRDEVFVDCFKPGGQGKALDAKISALAGIPDIYPNYTKEYKMHLNTIEDPYTIPSPIMAKRGP